MKVSLPYQVVALLMVVSYGRGQDLRTATLVGTVTDTSGAVVPKGDVSVQNIETQVVTRGVTNENGAYYLPFLIPGSVPTQRYSARVQEV